MEPRSLSHAAREKNSQLKRNSAETWLKGRDVEAAREFLLVTQIPMRETQSQLKRVGWSSASSPLGLHTLALIRLSMKRPPSTVYAHSCSRLETPCTFVESPTFAEQRREAAERWRETVLEKRRPGFAADLLRAADGENQQAKRTEWPAKRTGKESVFRFRANAAGRSGRAEGKYVGTCFVVLKDREEEVTSFTIHRPKRHRAMRNGVCSSARRRTKQHQRAAFLRVSTRLFFSPPELPLCVALYSAGDVDAREQLLPRREREKPSFHGEAAATSREALNGEKNDAPRPSKVRCKKRRASRTHDKERRGKRRREPNGKGSEKKEAEEREREDRPGFRRKGLPRQLSGPPPLRRSVHGTSREEVLTFRRPMERFSRSRRSVELEKRREEAVRSRKKRRFPGRESPETELKTLSLSGKRPPTAAAVFQVYYRFTCRAHTGSRRFSVPVSAPSPSFFSSEMLVADHLTLVICAYSVPSLNQELFRLTAEGAAVRSMSLDGIWQVSTQHRQTDRQTDRHTQYMYLLLGLQRSKPRMQQGVVVAEEGRGDCK
uniref:Uncharacterized protein n=1 Tax=Toxoplasma gondii COUG TaxID=1074873 RepID=A0A2G8Y6V1_TOXGO|nr:hypothetical protein TGCOUG_392370 [Toxoplasma gondii COUG]